MKQYSNPLALGSAVQYLLVANLVVFVIQIWLQFQVGNTNGMFNIIPGWFESVFGLRPSCLFYSGGIVTIGEQSGSLRNLCPYNFQLWQPATYMFLHGGLWHIGFNMLALWMFGTMLERIWGLKRFLFFYFFCGIGAGILVSLIAFITQGNDLIVVTIGASGSVLGLLTAYGMLFPNNIIYMYFMPVKAKYAVWIFGGFSLMFAISGNFAGISHWGHLGGILFGLIAMNGRKWLAQLNR